MQDNENLLKEADFQTYNYIYIIYVGYLGRASLAGDATLGGMNVARLPCGNIAHVPVANP